MKLKITKERLDQIMQEEYQRIQEEKSTEEELEAEYKAAKQKLDKGATTEDQLDGLKALEDMFLRLGVGHPSKYYRLAHQAILDYKKGLTKAKVDRNMPGLRFSRGGVLRKEEEHAEPVGAGIEDISADDVLGNQPGLGFDIGSQQAFAELYARYSGGKDKAQIATDFEKIDALGDEKLSKMFKAFILRNTLLFPDETPGSVDLLRNDPEAVEAAVSAIPDEVPEGPPESEEDMDSLIDDIKRLMKQQGNL